jgi:hypothetical protein
VDRNRNLAAAMTIHAKRLNTTDTALATAFGELNTLLKHHGINTNV